MDMAAETILAAVSFWLLVGSSLGFRERAASSRHEAEKGGRHPKGVAGEGKVRFVRGKGWGARTAPEAGVQICSAKKK